MSGLGWEEEACTAPGLRYSPVRHAGTAQKSRCCLATPAVGGGLLHYISFIMGYFWPETLFGVLVVFFVCHCRALYCSIMVTVLYGPLSMPRAAELLRLNLKTEAMVRSAGVAVRVLPATFLSEKGGIGHVVTHSVS